MLARQFTPRELRDMIDAGRIIELVPVSELEHLGRVGNIVVTEWLKGPHGHALIGVCPHGCHVVAEFPRQWRSRGRDLARRIPEPDPDFVRKVRSEMRAP